MPYFLVTNSFDCDLLRGLYISSAASGVTYILSRGKLNSLAMSFLENSETVIASLCGTKSEVLPVSSFAALDTFIDGTKVYSFQPYYSDIKGGEFDGLDGKTVETNDYTVKFVKAKTCSKISNGSWKGENDKNTCPTGYKPKVISSTVGAAIFGDGPCYSCEKIEDKTITIYLTNTETKDQSSSTLICNGEIERVNSTTKEYVEFSHDTNHTVKLRLNGPNKPCTELYADSIVLDEDNSYDLYAEFPNGGGGSISGYYYDNVPTSFDVIVDGVVVASDEIRRGKIDQTNWTHLRVLSSLNGKVIQPSKSNPYTIKFVYENEKNNTCYKKSSSGTVENKSTIYYYPSDELYVQGACASEMILDVVCDNTNLKAKLYVNGKETQANPNSYQNTEGKWFGDFMNCTGCAQVKCTFKYGDKTEITIPQTAGPGD